MVSMLHSWQSDPLKDWCNILEYRGSFAVEYFPKIAKVSQNTYVQIYILYINAFLKYTATIQNASNKS